MAYNPVVTSACIAINGLLHFRDQTSLEVPVESTCVEHGHDLALYGIVLHTAYDIQKLILNEGHKAYNIADDLLGKRKRSETFRSLEKSQLSFVNDFIINSQLCLSEAEEQTQMKKAFFKRMHEKMTLFSHFLDLNETVSQQEAEPLLNASILVDNTIKEYGSAIIGYQPKVRIILDL